VSHTQIFNRLRRYMASRSMGWVTVRLRARHPGYHGPAVNAPEPSPKPAYPRHIPGTPNMSSTHSWHPVVALVAFFGNSARSLTRVRRART